MKILNPIPKEAYDPERLIIYTSFCYDTSFDPLFIHSFVFIKNIHPIRISSLSYVSNEQTDPRIKDLENDSGIFDFLSMNQHNPRKRDVYTVINTNVIEKFFLELKFEKTAGRFCLISVSRDMYSDFSFTMKRSIYMKVKFHSGHIYLPFSSAEEFYDEVAFIHQQTGVQCFAHNESFAVIRSLPSNEEVKGKLTEETKETLRDLFKKGYKVTNANDLFSSAPGNYALILKNEETKDEIKVQLFMESDGSPNNILKFFFKECDKEDLKSFLYECEQYDLAVLVDIS